MARFHASTFLAPPRQPSVLYRVHASLLLAGQDLSNPEPWWHVHLLGGRGSTQYLMMVIKPSQLPKIVP